MTRGVDEPKTLCASDELTVRRLFDVRAWLRLLINPNSSVEPQQTRLIRILIRFLLGHILHHPLAISWTFFGNEIRLLHRKCRDRKRRKLLRNFKSFIDVYVVDSFVDVNNLSWNSFSMLVYLIKFCGKIMAKKSFSLPRRFNCWIKERIRADVEKFWSRNNPADDSVDEVRLALWKIVNVSNSSHFNY